MLYSFWCTPLELLLLHVFLSIFECLDGSTNEIMFLFSLLNFSLLVCKIQLDL